MQIYLLLICGEELDGVTVSCSWSLTCLSHSVAEL